MTRSEIYDVSVIIPSYNSGTHLFDCLESVVTQKTTYSYEVIVVDSSQVDVTPWIRERYLCVRTIHLPERAFPGTARNIGVEEARGRVIAFTDTDCLNSKGRRRVAFDSLIH